MAKAKKAAGAAASSSDFAEGDRVKFLRSHNKALELVGKVVKVHESGDVLDIETEVDEKLGIEGHVETVAVSDVKHAADGDTHRHVGDGSR